ncbi:DUF3987 domain-containing protein [Kitasatospora sp. NPDC096147]|uniref:DUF3987 domain-containing protein n=1 Tax=Kitasatospora sp. NPDC096147 TaxID=3364093 RepID=UPI0037FACC9F
MTTFDAMKYGPLGDAVAAAVPDSEADPIGIYAATLALYSAALSRSVTMTNGRPVVVWTVLAGKSSLGRKGYALGTTRTLLSKSIGGFLGARVASGISSGPSLVNHLFQLELETAGTESGMDGRALVVEEEWAGVLKRAKRCPTFSQHLRSAWDGKRVSNVIKSKDGSGEQIVERPLLGFHAHITPGEWAKYVDGTDALGGQFNRLLPVLVERSKMLPWDHQERIAESKALTAAYRWAQREPRRMALTAEAGRRYDELRALIETRMADMPESLSCYLERSAEQVVRVAAVLTAAEMKTRISRAALDAAWAFVSYSMTSVEKLVHAAANTTGRAVKELPELIYEILDRYEGEATSTMMLRALGTRVTAASLRAAVEDMDDVEMVKGENPGRGAKPTIYRRITSPELAAPQGEIPKPASAPPLRLVVPRRPAAPTKARPKSAQPKAPAPVPVPTPATPVNPIQLLLAL